MAIPSDSYVQQQPTADTESIGKALAALPYFHAHDCYQLASVLAYRHTADAETRRNFEGAIMAAFRAARKEVTK
jgi:hypothetical protein